MLETVGSVRWKTEGLDGNSPDLDDHELSKCGSTPVNNAGPGSCNRLALLSTPAVV